jgi:hypothetical protein
MPMSDGFLAFREGSARCALRPGHGTFLRLTEDSPLSRFLPSRFPLAGRLLLKTRVLFLLRLAILPLDLLYVLYHHVLYHPHRESEQRSASREHAADEVAIGRAAARPWLSRDDCDGKPR